MDKPKPFYMVRQFPTLPTDEAGQRLRRHGTAAAHGALCESLWGGVW